MFCAERLLALAAETQASSFLLFLTARGNCAEIHRRGELAKECELCHEKGQAAMALLVSLRACHRNRRHLPSFCIFPFLL